MCDRNDNVFFYHQDHASYKRGHSPVGSLDLMSSGRNEYLQGGLICKVYRSDRSYISIFEPS
jgi:hypothetical protein